MPVLLSGASDSAQHARQMITIIRRTRRRSYGNSARVGAHAGDARAVSGTSERPIRTVLFPGGDIGQVIGRIAGGGAKFGRHPAVFLSRRPSRKPGRD
jgi:hypothetical protein